MKRLLLSFATTSILLAFSTPSIRADDLADLAGKWSAQRTDDEGRTVKQVLAIKQDKFTFTILTLQNETLLYAEGSVKAEALGPFKSARFYNIQGGRSSSDLQSVDDERTVIYMRGDADLTMAVDFDRIRNEPPRSIKYTKVSEESRALIIDKIVMHTTPQSDEWYLCFEASVGDETKRFNLPGKTWSKNEVTIATDLSIANVRPNQTCKFVMKLDDVAGDECTEEMDDKSTGTFAATDNGSQDFKPEAGWSYTIYWHLK